MHFILPHVFIEFLLSRFINLLAILLTYIFTVFSLSLSLYFFLLLIFDIAIADIIAIAYYEGDFLRGAK